MKFINIITCANNSVWINVNFIESITPINNKTIIYLSSSNGEYYETYESIEEIFNKIKNDF